MFHKERQNGTARAEPVAESDEHKRCSIPRFIRIGEHEFFAQHFRYAVDGNGADGFVGRNEHEAADAVSDARIEKIFRTEYVVFDRGDGIFFHERNVLIGGAVEHDVAFHARNDVVDIVFVFHVADDRHDRRFFADAFFLQKVQFAVYLIDGIFAVPEKVQTFGPARQKLT